MYMWVTFRITQENMSDEPPLSGRALTMSNIISISYNLEIVTFELVPSTLYRGLRAYNFIIKIFYI